MMDLGYVLLVISAVVVGYRVGQAWKFEEPVLTQKRVAWQRFEREVNEDARRRLALAATEDAR